MPRLRLEPTDDADAWNRLVAASAARTPFHEWSWLDLHAGLQGVIIERLLVTGDGEPLGVFPVVRPSARSIDSVTLPFPFLGPLVPAGLMQEACLALRRRQRRRGPVLARFDLGAPLAVDGRPALAAAAVTWHEDSTVVIDTSHGSIDALWAGFSSMRRRSIRKAEHSGGEVRTALPGEIATLLPQVLDEAYGAHAGDNPYPADTGARVERWLAGRDDVCAATVLVEGEPAGVYVTLGGAPVAMAWAGGALRRFRDQNPNVLLYRHFLEWAVTRGLDAVDLAGRVDEGILRFKLSFGGVELPYLAAESFIGPAFLRRRPAPPASPTPSPAAPSSPDPSTSAG